MKNILSRLTLPLFCAILMIALGGCGTGLENTIKSGIAAYAKGSSGASEAETKKALCKSAVAVATDCHKRAKNGQSCGAAGHDIYKFVKKQAGTEEQARNSEAVCKASCEAAKGGASVASVQATQQNGRWCK